MHFAKGLSKQANTDDADHANRLKTRPNKPRKPPRRRLLKTKPRKPRRKHGSLHRKPRRLKTRPSKPMRRHRRLHRKPPRRRLLKAPRHTSSKICYA